MERATDTEEILRFNNDSVVILDFLLLIIFQICFSSSPQFFNPQELMTRFQLILPVHYQNITKKIDGSQDARSGSPDIPNQPSEQ